MKKFNLLIFLIWMIALLVSCGTRKNRSVTVRELNRRTGEVIVVDNLVQKYENEHQELYKREIMDGDGYLKWPTLDNKNLSIYCRKYLQHFVPSRTTDSAIGYKFRNYLHYEKENIGVINEVVIVQCKITNTLREVSYYMTRAPSENCVYALKRIGNNKKCIFNVINKCCDFEDKLLRNSTIMKRKRGEIIKMVHMKTGQPIAKDEYLLEYELEHKKLLWREAISGKHIDWPQVMLRGNLNSYCCQYLKTVVPRRYCEGVLGYWKITKLHYQKLKPQDEIFVTTVVCQPPYAYKQYQYYMTRAPETNCVYALLWKNYHSSLSLIIVFKHCEFADSNDNQTIARGYNVHYKNLIPKTELKEEIFDSMETLQLFQNN